MTKITITRASGEKEVVEGGGQTTTPTSSRSSGSRSSSNNSNNNTWQYAGKSASGTPIYLNTNTGQRIATNNQTDLGSSAVVKGGGAALPEAKAEAFSKDAKTITVTNKQGETIERTFDENIVQDKITSSPVVSPVDDRKARIKQSLQSNAIIMGGRARVVGEAPTPKPSIFAFGAGSAFGLEKTSTTKQIPISRGSPYDPRIKTLTQTTTTTIPKVRTDKIVVGTLPFLMTPLKSQTVKTQDAGLIKAGFEMKTLQLGYPNTGYVEQTTVIKPTPNKISLFETKTVGKYSSEALPKYDSKTAIFLTDENIPKSTGKGKKFGEVNPFANIPFIKGFNKKSQGYVSGAEEEFTNSFRTNPVSTFATSVASGYLFGKLGKGASVIGKGLKTSKFAASSGVFGTTAKVGGLLLEKSPVIGGSVLGSFYAGSVTKQIITAPDDKSKGAVIGKTARELTGFYAGVNIGSSAAGSIGKGTTVKTIGSGFQKSSSFKQEGSFKGDSFSRSIKVIDNTAFSTTKTNNLRVVSKSNLISGKGSFKVLKGDKIIEEGTFFQKPAKTITPKIIKGKPLEFQQSGEGFSDSTFFRGERGSGVLKSESTGVNVKTFLIKSSLETSKLTIREQARTKSKSSPKVISSESYSLDGVNIKTLKPSYELSGGGVETVTPRFTNAKVKPKSDIIQRVETDKGFDIIKTKQPRFSSITQKESFFDYEGSFKESSRLKPFGKKGFLQTSSLLSEAKAVGKSRTNVPKPKSAISNKASIKIPSFESTSLRVANAVKGKTRLGVIPAFGLTSSTRSSSASSSNQSFFSNYKSRELVGVIPVSASSIKQSTDQSQRQSQKSKSSLVSSFLTPTSFGGDSTSSPSSTVTSFNIIPPPIVPFLPKLNIGGGGSGVGKKKNKLSKSRRAYTPSLTSASFGIVGTPSKSGVITGLGIRPIKRRLL